MNYTAAKAEQNCRLLVSTFQTLTSPEFVAMICRRKRLQKFDPELRKEAVELAISELMVQIIAGEFTPDPAKNLAAIVAQRAEWRANDLLHKRLPTTTEFDAVHARDPYETASDLKLAALFAAACGLSARLRAAFWSDPKNPWLHSVAEFVEEQPAALQPAVAKFAGFPPNQSFSLAKNRAHAELGERAKALIDDSTAFEGALAMAMASADTTLVGNPQRLVESPLSSDGARYAAAALREATRRGMPIPVAFATEVALRLDVGNCSDEAKDLLSLILTQAGDEMLRAQASIALGIVLDHQAAHAEDERDWDRALKLLEIADDVMKQAAASGASLPVDTLNWLEYQRALNGRRRVEVRLATLREAPHTPPARFSATELENDLVIANHQFQDLLATATDIAQRLAIMHQLAVVETLRAELRRAGGNLSGAKKAYLAAESALLETRWLSVAHGKNSGRRYAYSYRRLGLVYAELAELATKPDERASHWERSFNELQHALMLAKKHQFWRLQREIGKNLAVLFPDGPPAPLPASLPEALAVADDPT